MCQKSKGIDTPKKIVVDLLSDIGAITGTERVSLDAAYRIGKPKQNQTSPRNIMVRFKDMEHKMRLFQEITKMRHIDRWRDVYVSDDLCIEQQSDRKERSRYFI